MKRERDNALSLIDLSRVERVAELEAALRPFAAVAALTDRLPADVVLWQHNQHGSEVAITVGDARIAARALTETEGGE